VHRNLIVPDFRRIINFRTDVMSLFNNGIKLSGKEVTAFDFGHSDGKTEVSDDEFAFTVDEQVFWLDVSMDNAVRVQVLDSFHELTEDVTGCVFVKPLGVLDERVELPELC